MFVLVNNSALVSVVYVTSCVITTPSPQPATRGTVNGIGQSLVAIGRSTGPLIGAPLFAWSEGNGKIWCVCVLIVGSVSYAAKLALTSHIYLFDIKSSIFPLLHYTAL